MSWCHYVMMSWCHDVMMSWCYDVMKIFSLWKFFRHENFFGIKIFSAWKFFRHKNLKNFKSFKNFKNFKKCHAMIIASRALLGLVFSWKFFFHENVFVMKIFSSWTFFRHDNFLVKNINNFKNFGGSKNFFQGVFMTMFITSRTLFGGPVYKVWFGSDGHPSHCMTELSFALACPSTWVMAK